MRAQRWHQSRSFYQRVGGTKALLAGLWNRLSKVLKTEMLFTLKKRSRIQKCCLIKPNRWKEEISSQAWKFFFIICAAFSSSPEVFYQWWKHTCLIIPHLWFSSSLPFVTGEEISVYNKSIHLSTTKKTHFFANSKVCIFRITFRTRIIINADVILL